MSDDSHEGDNSGKGNSGRSPIIRSNRTKKKASNKKGDGKSFITEENSVTSTTKPKVSEIKAEVPESQLQEPPIPKVEDKKTSIDGDSPSPVENGAEAISLEKKAEENDFERRTVLPLNVKEKIIFCIDTFEDPKGSPFNFTNGKMYKTLTMIQRICTLFLKLKNKINNEHEFALIELDGDSAQWKNDFTADISEVIANLENITPKEAESSNFNLSSLFEVIMENVSLPRVSEMSTNQQPPFVLRVIVIYSRSQCIPEFISGTNTFKQWCASSPNCFLDTLYLHENADDDNNCKKIYENLRGIESESSFSFQVIRSASDLHNSMAKLLAHPLQRLDCKHTSYKLLSIQAGRNGTH